MNGRGFRIIRASDESLLEPTTVAPKERFRHVPRPIVDANAEAARVRQAATVEAARIVDEAKLTAASLGETLQREAQEAAAAAWSAEWLLLHRARERQAEDDLERTVGLAQLLAERLLGEALTQDPGVVAKLARQALREARGARRVRIVSCAGDRHTLEAMRGQLGLPEESLEFEVSNDLAPGSLILVTDVGRTDARVSVQLQRLGAVLHDALRS